jgi:hypothetical protein
VPSIPLSGDAAGSRAGSYETLEGARLAVDHLIDEGVEGDAVAIVPRDLGVENVRPVLSRLRAGAPIGVAFGALLGLINGATLAIVSEVSFWSIAMWAGGGAVVGLAIAATAVLIDAHRASSAGSVERERLAAGRFDVVVTTQAARSRHVLARWWDPAARPAPVHEGGAPPDFEEVVE